MSKVVRNVNPRRDANVLLDHGIVVGPGETTELPDELATQLATSEEWELVDESKAHKKSEDN